MSAQPEPLVSVVTPVYNGGQWLRECIESVLAQRYQNWRYTIVNNCSTDDSREIAADYARQDARLRVHDNPDFLPIIDNHNHAVALIEADSVYCKPLMADDWLYPECLQEMVGCAVAHPAVGLVCCLAHGPWTGACCMTGCACWMPRPRPRRRSSPDGMPGASRCSRTGISSAHPR